MHYLCICLLFLFMVFPTECILLLCIKSFYPKILWFLPMTALLNFITSRWYIVSCICFSSSTVVYDSIPDLSVLWNIYISHLGGISLMCYEVTFPQVVWSTVWSDLQYINPFPPIWNVSFITRVCFKSTFLLVHGLSFTRTLFFLYSDF